MTRAKQTYSPDKRAEVMAHLEANGGNVSSTSRDTGVPRKTIERWRDGKDELDEDLVEQKKEDLAETLEKLAFSFCTALSKRLRSGKADTKEMCVGLGIAVDKLLLLRGSPTSITRNDSTTATIDFSRLSPNEILVMHALQTKALGQQLDEASDLSAPVVVRMDEPDEPEAVPTPAHEAATQGEQTAGE